MNSSSRKIFALLKDVQPQVKDCTEPKFHRHLRQKQWLFHAASSDNESFIQAHFPAKFNNGVFRQITHK